MASKTAVKTQRIVKPLGKLWGRSVQEMVTKAALTQARCEVRSGKHDGKDEVEVVIPVTFTWCFRAKGNPSRPMAASDAIAPSTKTRQVRSAPALDRVRPIAIAAPSWSD